MERLNENRRKRQEIVDIVVGAKAPSATWNILTCMVEDDCSERAREQAKKNIEGLSMDNVEPMEEYIAQEKYLVLNAQYRDIKVTEQEISCRRLNGLPLRMLPRNGILI